MHQPNDMLHAWIDGELDPTLETQFFSQLAADSELREKLRHMRNIRMEAQKFGATVQPPAEMSERVFARLGFASQAVTASSTSRRPAVLAAFKRAWAPVASAAAAAVITAILILGLHDPMNDAALQTLADGHSPASAVRSESPHEHEHGPRDQSALAEVDAQHASVTDESDRAATAGSGPSSTARMRAGGMTDSDHPAGVRDENPAGTARAATSDRQDRDLPPNDLQERSIAGAAIQKDDAAITNPPGNTGDITTSGSGDVSGSRAGSVSSEDATKTGASGVPDTPPAWRNPAAEQAAALPTVHAMRESPGSGAATPVDTRQYFPGLLTTDIPPALSVEFRGMNTTSFPSATIATSSNPWMQNMAIAVFHTSGQHDLGLEFGQEPFAMHYHGIENGKAVRYEQNLLTPWLLASWRYRLHPFSVAGIEPYFTASLGSSLYFWPMARTGAGLMYMPDRRVRFHIGVEGSMLAYPYQEQWFTSRRVGLTYGLSVLF